MSLKTLNLIISFFVVVLFSCNNEKYESFSENKPLAQCINGIAKFNLNDKIHEYECNKYDLMGFVSLDDMDASIGNDCWGWTDPLSKNEYALMGLDNGTGIINVTNPTKPRYLGKIPTASASSMWRDIKVFNNYAFIVSEASGHGLQIFDLTKLRGISDEQTHSVDLTYNGFGQAHNIAINEESGYAYPTGIKGKGLHILNVKDPINPVLELEYPENGYTHDAQVVNYKGPDQNYYGKEIFIGSNEDRLVLVDVTNKLEPKIVSVFNYDHQYTHQSWITSDHQYILMGDEYDELNIDFQLINKTRTIIINIEDLENPKLHFNYLAKTDAIDHNGYVKGSNFYLASYTSGLRVIEILNISNKNINEVGFFDTHNSTNHSNLAKSVSFKPSDPGDHDDKKGLNIKEFNGAWSVYPFFNSDNIIVSDINSGLFIVRKSTN